MQFYFWYTPKMLQLWQLYSMDLFTYTFKQCPIYFVRLPRLMCLCVWVLHCLFHLSYLHCRTYSKHLLKPKCLYHSIVRRLRIFAQTNHLYLESFVRNTGQAVPNGSQLFRGFYARFSRTIVGQVQDTDPHHHRDVCRMPKMSVRNMAFIRIAPLATGPLCWRALSVSVIFLPSGQSPCLICRLQMFKSFYTL